MTYDAQAIFFAGLELIIDGFLKGYVLFVLILTCLSAIYAATIGKNPEP